jgi:hypothetical protein
MRTDNTHVTGGKGKPAPKIPAPGRDTHGRFLKGASANPKGRPLENVEVKELARRQGPAAIVRLTQLMHCDDPQVCIAAARALLDRGFGRPEQSIALDATIQDYTREYNGPVIDVSDPISLATAYQEIMRGNRDSRSLIIEHKPLPPVPEHPPAQTAAPLPEPVVEHRPRFESDPEPEEVVEAVETNVTALRASRHSGEHHPIVDSKCAFCRQLYSREREAAKDEALRHQRPPRAVT